MELALGRLISEKKGLAQAAKKPFSKSIFRNTGKSVYLFSRTEFIYFDVFV